MQFDFKQAMKSTEAAAGRGPYPQAIHVGPLVLLSGQGPLSRETNQPIDEDFTAQVRLTFSNVEKILLAAGLSLAHVVKVTVYLTDIQRVAEFNRLYEQLMPKPHPARTLVQVGLRGIEVELDVIAAHPGIAGWTAASR